MKPFYGPFPAMADYRYKFYLDQNLTLSMSYVARDDRWYIAIAHKNPNPHSFHLHWVRETLTAKYEQYWRTRRTISQDSIFESEMFLMNSIIRVCNGDLALMANSCKEIFGNTFWYGWIRRVKDLAVRDSRIVQAAHDEYIKSLIT